MPKTSQGPAAWRRLRRVALLGFSIVTIGRAAAADDLRQLSIAAPPAVAPGQPTTVVTHVRTTAGAGERIGFLHGEFSRDGGRTWTAFCYEADLGAEARRTAHIEAPAAGQEIVVRVRVAFRGGVAGDVDYRGAAIRWQDGWGRWEEPPARRAVIRVNRPAQ